MMTKNRYDRGFDRAMRLLRTEGVRQELRAGMRSAHRGRSADGTDSSDLHYMIRALEAVAVWATWLARYFDARDWAQADHEAAIKKANRAATIVWCKALGYQERLT